MLRKSHSHSDPTLSTVEMDKAICIFYSVLMSGLASNHISGESIIPPLFMIQADDEEEMEMLKILHMMSERGKQVDSFDNVFSSSIDNESNVDNNNGNIRFMANFQINVVSSSGKDSRISAITVALPPATNYVYSCRSNRKFLKPLELFIKETHAAVQVRDNIHDDDDQLFYDLFENPLEPKISSFAEDKINIFEEESTDQILENKHAQPLSHHNYINLMLPSYIERIPQVQRTIHTCGKARKNKKAFSSEDEDLGLFSHSYGEHLFGSDSRIAPIVRIENEREQLDEQTETHPRHRVSNTDTRQAMSPRNLSPNNRGINMEREALQRSRQKKTWINRGYKFLRNRLNSMH